MNKNKGFIGSGLIIAIVFALLLLLLSGIRIMFVVVSLLNPAF
jgi:hypothetical protein